ncbi:MAG: PEP-CTERM sorting domain-containing protein [Scytonema sp. PMC 1069.18]|nr:PEP-CTERM sorting domain-containing protein [Scytonema sp. PMC 1069.18]MEC4882078.1 PEP-CTERM sorting domain-containing protein [Scytonema sp. PMC 1070.18]
MKNVVNILGSALLATGLAVSVMAAPAHAENNGNGGNSGNGGNNNNAGNNSNVVSSVTCAVNNVSLGGVNATACQGPFSGNDTGAQGTLLNDLNNGLFAANVGSDVTWSLAGKSDESNNFLTAANGSSAGSWSLKNALSTDTFVLSLKTSTAYSAYLFTGIDFAETGLNGLFNTIGVALDGSGNAGKGLSHASLYLANKPNTPKKVPEPSALIGLGLAVGGMVVTRRRKSN